MTDILVGIFQGEQRMAMSKKFDEALQYAAELHREQTRKGTGIPYVGHLLSVAGLVLENDGSEVQAIAALLHDAIEDQAETIDDAQRLGAEIETRFGSDVRAIVEACTDAWENPKPEWRPRKEQYIQHIAAMDPTTALVSLADKVHNARAIVADLRRIGTDVFKRFNGKQEGTLWYYEELARAFVKSHPQPLADELSRVVDEMTAQCNSTPSSYLSVAWPPFAQRLASVLEKLEEDQYLILSAKRSNRFVQFAAQGSFGMRMETTSNSYLAKAEQLDQRQISALIDAGWNVPTRSPARSTPQADPDGSPNFFVEWSVPVSFAAAADLTVRTLAEILRLPHPGFLEYKAFDKDRGAIALPELGLRLAKREKKTQSPENSSQSLLDTLKESTGIADLTIDDDGDIGIRSGSALAFVRLIDNPPYVRIYSRILSEVEESPGVFARLNDINANEILMRFVFRNGSIFASADICAEPFVSGHVAQAFVHFCAIADGMDGLLQEEFGGRTAFAESMPSSMKH